MTPRHRAFCRPDARSWAARSYRAAAGAHRSNPCDVCQRQMPAGQAGLCEWCRVLEVDQPRADEWWVA